MRHPRRGGSTRRSGWVSYKKPNTKTRIRRGTTGIRGGRSKVRMPQRRD